jgi:hypothetical protein
MDYERTNQSGYRERTYDEDRNRRGSIFGREKGSADRGWRDEFRSRDESLIRNRRDRSDPNAYGSERSRRFERGRSRGEREFGPDDYRDELPRDETSHLIASNKVEGTAVYGRDGDRLGTIYNFMVDKRSGRVEYAVMSYGGFLGMGDQYYPLPWRMLTYRTDLGGYEIELTERDLDEAPSFNRRTEPRFNRAYSRDVYGYYGVPY